MNIESVSMAYLFFIDEMTFIVVFGLAFFASVPFILIGVVYYILKKNRKAVVSWEKLASDFGFNMPEPGKLKMVGDYNGLEATVSIRVETDRSGDTTTTSIYTYCTMKFPEPLRFALLLNSPKAWLTGLGNAVKIGQPFYDDEFDSICYDVEVLRRLLLSDFPSKETTNLAGDLLLTKRSFNTVRVNDTHTLVETNGQIDDHDVIKVMLGVNYRLASRLEKARAAFPKAEWEKQLMDNWKGISEHRSFVVDEANLKMRGNDRGFPFEATVFAEPGVWKTTIDIRFPEPLMIGFNIYPEKSIYKAFKLFGFQDIKAGHEEFDKAFIVKAKNVKVAQSKMTPDFCGQMVGLDQHTHDISLTDEGMKITLEKVLGDDNSLMSYIRALTSAMEKLR